MLALNNVDPAHPLLLVVASPQARISFPEAVDLVVGLPIGDSRVEGALKVGGYSKSISSYHYRFCMIAAVAKQRLLKKICPVASKARGRAVVRPSGIWPRNRTKPTCALSSSSYEQDTPLFIPSGHNAFWALRSQDDLGLSDAGGHASDHAGRMTNPSDPHLPCATNSVIDIAGNTCSLRTLSFTLPLLSFFVTRATPASGNALMSFKSAPLYTNTFARFAVFK